MPYHSVNFSDLSAWRLPHLGWRTARAAGNDAAAAAAAAAAAGGGGRGGDSASASSAAAAAGKKFKLHALLHVRASMKGLHLCIHVSWPAQLGLHGY